MSIDTAQNSDASVTHLLTGIVADAQDLGLKHLELFRSEVLEEIRKTTVELRKMAEDLNAGKGTAGKLLKSDELSTNINKLLAKIDATIDKVNSGQGTLGQLMVNPQLYESMNGTMKEVNGLMKDFRSNPKKFLTIQLKLF